MNINQCMVVMKLVIQNHLDLSYGQKFMIFQMKLYQYPNHCHNYLTNALMKQQNKLNEINVLI